MQISKIFITGLFILTILAINYNPLPALAQPLESVGAPSRWLQVVNEDGLNQVGNTAYGTTRPKDVRWIVADIINVILGLLGMIFVVLMIVGGFRWMTAGGNDEKVTKARQTLTTAAIGLLIILASLSISWYATSRAVHVTTEGTSGATIQIGS